MKKVLSVILSLSLAATQATSKCSALNVTDMLEHLPEETKVALTQYLSGKKNLTDMNLSLNISEYKALVSALKNSLGFGNSTYGRVVPVEDNSTSVATQESNETSTETTETAEPTVIPQVEILSGEEKADDSTTDGAAELVKTTTIANAVFGGGGLIATIKAWLNGKKVTSLQQLLGEANTEKADLGRQLGEANTEKADLGRQLGEANAEKEDLGRQLDDANANLDEAQGALETANTENVDLKGRLETANAANENLARQLDEAQGDLGEANAANARLQEALETANTEKETLQGNLEKAQEDLRTANADNARLQGNLEKVQGELGAAKTELQGKNAELQKNLDSANEAKDALGEQLNQANIEKANLQANFDTEKAELQRNLDTATGENTQLPGQNEESVSELDADSDISMQEEIARFYKEADELEKNVDMVKERNKQLQVQNENLGRQIDEAKAEKEELDKKAKELKKKIEELEKMRSDRKDARTNTAEEQDSDDDKKGWGVDAAIAVGSTFMSMPSNGGGKSSAHRNRSGLGGLALTAVGAGRAISRAVGQLRRSRSLSDLLDPAVVEELVEQDSQKDQTSKIKEIKEDIEAIEAVVMQLGDALKDLESGDLTNDTADKWHSGVEPEASTYERQSAGEAAIERFTESGNLASQDIEVLQLDFPDDVVRTGAQILETLQGTELLTSWMERLRDQDLDLNYRLSLRVGNTDLTYPVNDFRTYAADALNQNASMTVSDFVAYLNSMRSQMQQSANNEEQAPVDNEEELPPIVEPEAQTDEGQSADDKDLERFEEDENDVATSNVKEEDADANEGEDEDEIPVEEEEEFISDDGQDNDNRQDDDTQHEETSVTSENQDVGADVAPEVRFHQGTPRVSPWSRRMGNMLRTPGSVNSAVSDEDAKWNVLQNQLAENNRIGEEVAEDLEAFEPANVYARVFGHNNFGEILTILSGRDSFRQALNASGDTEWVDQVFSDAFVGLLDQVRQALGSSNTSYADVEEQLIRQILAQNSIDAEFIDGLFEDGNDVTFDQAIQALRDAGRTNEDAVIVHLENARNVLNSALEALEIVLNPQPEEENSLGGVAKALTFESDAEDETKNEDIEHAGNTVETPAPQDDKAVDNGEEETSEQQPDEAGANPPAVVVSVAPEVNRAQSETPAVPTGNTTEENTTLPQSENAAPQGENPAQLQGGNGVQLEAGQDQHEELEDDYFMSAQGSSSEEENLENTENGVSQSAAERFSLFDAEEDDDEKSECTTREQEDEKAKKTPKK